MSDSKGFKDMAKALRKAGDIAENIANVMDDISLTSDEKEAKAEQLLGEFMVQMMKLQALKL